MKQFETKSIKVNGQKIGTVVKVEEERYLIRPDCHILCKDVIFPDENYAEKGLRDKMYALYLDLKKAFD